MHRKHPSSRKKVHWDTKNCVCEELRRGSKETRIAPEQERHCTPKTFPFGPAHACLARGGRISTKGRRSRTHTHAHGVVDFPIKWRCAALTSPRWTRSGKTSYRGELCDPPSLRLSPPPSTPSSFPAFPLWPSLYPLPSRRPSLWMGRRGLVALGTGTQGRRDGGGEASAAASAWN